MNDKWMIIYKESIASKIARFFRNLFRKKEYLVISYDKSEDKEKETKDNKDDKQKFLDELKTQNSNDDIVIKKMELLNKVHGNAEELNKLTIEQLKKLQKYYSGIIEENDKIISRLKTNT